MQYSRAPSLNRRPRDLERRTHVLRNAEMHDANEQAKTRRRAALGHYLRNPTSGGLQGVQRPSLRRRKDHRERAARRCSALSGRRCYRYAVLSKYPYLDTRVHVELDTRVHVCTRVLVWGSQTGSGCNSDSDLDYRCDVLPRHPPILPLVRLQHRHGSGVATEANR